MRPQNRAYNVSGMYLCQRRRVGGNEICVAEERHNGMRKKRAERKYNHMRNSLLLDSKPGATICFYSWAARPAAATVYWQIERPSSKISGLPTEPKTCSIHLKSGAIARPKAGAMTELIQKQFQ